MGSITLHHVQVHECHRAHVHAHLCTVRRWPVPRSRHSALPSMYVARVPPPRLLRGSRHPARPSRETARPPARRAPQA
eukprot:5219758-Prymnesium_polylepis.1